jgi:hypothetical protein
MQTLSFCESSEEYDRASVRDCDKEVDLFDYFTDAAWRWKTEFEEISQ